ncbi:c-type cytochrome biogenesis protein CcsB, partial [bacterium]|nr:c-type cytochrome biogenesis protein CcsB [bacterium]
PEDSAIAIECIYNKVRPFHQAALLYLAAVACGICSLVAESRAKKVAGAVARSWPRWLALGTFAGALAFHVAGLVVRAYLEQRAPVASFYETLLWITGAASLIALVFGIVTRGSVVPPVVAGVVGALALTLGDNLKVYVETQNMEPLQPVLNSYWLNIHVTCMLTSYGAFALAFGTAIVYALAHARGAASGTSDAQKAQLEWLEDLNYRVIQVGFVLLTAGTGLGAVWANQSWGRYWGWDPKETGAFITWIVYAAYLHFRFMGWVKGIRSAVWNMAGFAMVMFTYIGVSFFLTGKHSYLE